MKTENRIIQIMKEEGMDTNDELLVVNVTLVYHMAQRDLLKEQMARK